jgi:glucosamine-6-phosphate deaminase
MEVVILPDAAALDRLAADAVEAVLRGREHPVLGLATGSSPLGCYAELRRRHREQGLSFARATAFLLDEYVGLPPGHPQRYRAVIDAELTSRVDLRPEAVHGPDGDAYDVPAACRAYDAAIAAAGGVDLQLLGIGTDGHLGFNEPGSSLAGRTRIKTLTARTRQDNARFFDHPDEVPRHVLTQGLGTILEARRLVLLATGVAKADAVAAAVEGPLTASCPASVLQLHPHASVLLDEAAAKGLARAGYYREVYAGKPSWQGL